MNKKVLISKYILFDLVAALIVWILFMIFRWVVNDGILFSNITIFVPNYNYYTNLVLFLLLCLLMHYLSGYYLNPIKESRFFEFFTTLLTTAIISVIIFFVMLIDDIVVDYTYYYYSLLVLYGLLFGFTWFFRIIQTIIIRRNFKRKKWTINTLIVGTGKNAQRIASEISKKSLFNTVVGYVKAESFEKDVPLELILGNVFEIGKLIENNDVSEVVVALDDPREYRIFDIINRLFQYDVDIWFTPRLYEILTGKVRVEKYGINPLVSVTQPTMSDWEFCVKRTMDIVVSVLSLILLLPFMIYFAIVIKIDSKGPVFYKQERIGRFGKSFNMLKFRSMYLDSEKGIPQLSGPEDDRVTKVGRTLRKYRIDEIPQFFNVIKGDMSLVGPRPERKYYIDQIVQEAPYYCLIYRIRPGLTSWGPIKIGYADTIEKMIERLNYDIVYTEDMNLATDVKIIFSTLEIIFRGKGI